MITWIRCGVRFVYEGREVNTFFLMTAVGEEVVVEEQIPGQSNEVRARIPIAYPSAAPELEAAVSTSIFANIRRDTA